MAWDDLPPKASWDELPPPSRRKKSMESFAKNTISDYKQNAQGLSELGAYAFPPLASMKAVSGENIYDSSRLQSMGTGMLKAIPQIPGQIAKSIMSPMESGYERPLSTALDIGSLVGAGVGGAKLGAMATRSTARKILPGLARGSAGIPEKATEMALKKPSILSQAPVAEGDLNRVVGEPLIDVMQQSKTRVQGVLGKAYKKYAGVDNPVEEMISSPPKPSKNFETLKAEYASAKDGSILKKISPETGGISEMTSKEKLKTLTLLKRDIQAEANFNKAPITNAPIDTVKDAALKKMGAEIDSLRSKIPNGKKLSVVDDAYKDLNDIYDTVQRDLSDPGKSRDTMMRLLRGDNTWLTSGKMKVKVDSIRKVEDLTGKKVLEPALEELTRQVFSQNMGKGFFPNTVRALATGMAGFGLGTANPAAIAGSGAMLAASSPKLIGLGIKGASKVGAGISKAFPVTSAIGSAAPIQGITKTLTKEKAKEYLRKAMKDSGGDIDKARELANERAKKDGFDTRKK